MINNNGKFVLKLEKLTKNGVWSKKGGAKSENERVMALEEVTLLSLHYWDQLVYAYNLTIKVVLFKSSLTQKYKIKLMRVDQKKHMPVLIQVSAHRL